MFKKPKNRSLIFCISFQRTGTTSTGQFFKTHGYHVGDWNISAKNNWGFLYFKGDYKKIFDSKDFKNNQVFEDGPWFCEHFYKYLFHRFSKSRFILLERDPDKWFDSMLSHSKGRTLGNTHSHSILYNREDEFYDLKESHKNLYTGKVDNLLPITEEHRKHYIDIYVNRNREVVNFFNTLDSKRIFTGKLEDADVWHKMGSFFNIDVPLGYQVHSNQSPNE